MKSSFFRHLLLLVWMLTTLGCPGGGGGGSAGGGIGGSGISSGTVTAFGSIESNGAVYNTDSADFTVDGQAGASQSDLNVGQVVQIRFVQSGLTRTATNVVYEDVVEGPVELVAADGLSLVVLGQTVLVNETTIVDNSIPGQDVTNLNPGDLVEVSGHVKANGVIAATFIELKAPPAEFEVKGFVENHNPGADTFTIGALTVDYSAAITSDMPAEATGWNDLLVEVKGTNLSAGVLTASKVEPEQLDGAEGDIAEVEGFVTQLFTSPPALPEFLLSNVRVQTTGSTIFSGGLPEEVVVGVKLEVDGAFLFDTGLGENVLVATKVSFRESVKLESDAATVAGSTVTLAGLTGITVQVDSQTELKNLTSLSDIDPSDPDSRHLRIRGRPTGVSSVIATELELRSQDTDVVLQGALDEDGADPNLKILNFTVDTSTIPDNKFEDANDMAIGRSLFFAAATTGTLVKVQGTLAGSVVTWEEAELED